MAMQGAGVARAVDLTVGREAGAIFTRAPDEPRGNPAVKNGGRTRACGRRGSRVHQEAKRRGTCPASPGSLDAADFFTPKSSVPPVATCSPLNNDSNPDSCK